MDSKKDKRPKELCLMCKIVILTLFVLVFTGSDLYVKQVAYDNLRDKPAGIDVIDGFWKFYYATNYDIGFGILGGLDKHLSTPSKIKTAKFEEQVIAKLGEADKQFMLAKYKVDDTGRHYVLDESRLSDRERDQIKYFFRRAGYRTPKWLFLVFLQGFGTLLVLIFFFYTKDKAQVFTLALIIGGALGNVVDRAMRGFVVDYVMWYTEPVDFKFLFIDLRGGFVWPIFNLADVYTVIGAALLFVIIMFFTKEEKPALKS